MEGGKEFSARETTKHSAKEDVRGVVHSNRVEGNLGLLKGVYHHCDEKRLNGYLAEFHSRCNHRTKLGYRDMKRIFEAIRGAEKARV